MQHKFLFALIVFPALAFSQDDTSRKLLLGQIVADSMDVENITIINQTTNITSITDGFGRFRIFAREKDTLVFSGLAFMARSMVVENSDFEFEILKIRMDVVVNPLQEVIIYPVKLTGNLDSDSKKIKAKTYGLNLQVPLGPLPKHMQDQSNKSPKNTSLPVTESQLQGIDFKLIGKAIIDLFRKPRPKEKKVFKPRPMVTFSDAARQKFSDHFFLRTLKLKPEEIGLFLNYCDTEEVYDKDLLARENEFQLTDYLIKKSAAFHKMNKQ